MPWSGGWYDIVFGLLKNVLKLDCSDSGKSVNMLKCIAFLKQVNWMAYKLYLNKAIY